MINLYDQLMINFPQLSSWSTFDLVCLGFHTHTHFLPKFFPTISPSLLQAVIAIIDNILRAFPFQEVVHEVSKNNSAVAGINTTANKLISRSDKAVAVNLREKIKNFNTEWADLKALLNKKQQDVLKLQSEIKTFDRAIDRETERIGEIQKDVQTCHESVGKDDTIMEKCLRVSRQNIVSFE